MIKELQKTFEYFPKRADEEDRHLSATSYLDAYEIRLVMYIEGVRYASTQQISKFESLKWNSDLEDVIIRRLCSYFQDKFGEEER